MSGTGMIRHQPAGTMTFAEQKEYAAMMAKSAVFKDCASAERALVKMEVAKSLGLHAVDGLRGIHIFDGKLELGVGIICSLIKKSGKYDYHIVQHTDEGCAIQFMHVLPDGTQKPIGYQLGDRMPKDSGVSVWTKADTERAGLAKKDNHAKYPKAMNFARALTQGARLFCPDIFGGSVYAEGEISDAIPGEVVSRSENTAPVVQATTPAVAGPVAQAAPADDATDVPFEPVAASTDPTPPADRPKTVEELTKDELVSRARSLMVELGVQPDQALRIIQRRDPNASKLADLSEEMLRELCPTLADRLMKVQTEAALA